MKIAFAFLFMMICCGKLFAQSKEVAVEDLKWVAVVSETEASFTFPPTNKEKFSWYKKDTPTDNLEYTWSGHGSESKKGVKMWISGDVLSFLSTCCIPSTGCC